MTIKHQPCRSSAVQHVAVEENKRENKHVESKKIGVGRESPKRNKKKKHV